MPLNKEAQKKLLKKLHYSDEDIVKLVDDEKEVDVTLDDKVSVFKEEEVQTLKSNSYKEGKKAGVEMEVDEIKKEMGLEFQGKTMKGLVEAANKKTLAEAKIEPNQKVQELNEKIATLQKTVGDQEKALADKESEVTGVKINGELYKHIPAFGDNAPALGQEEVITLMKANGYEFKLEEGKIVPYQNGKPLQDKTANPLNPKDVVGNFLREKKLVTETPTPGGRGGGDKTPAGKAGTLSELKKQFADQGKSLQGQEFMNAATEAAKDADFKMDA